MSDRGTVRAASLACALVAAAGLLAGCGQQIAGQARAVGDIDPGTVAGLPVTQGPSGPRPGVPNATMAVRNGDGGPMDTLAVNALSDIFGFWTTTLPSEFGGKKFVPVTKLISYDAESDDLTICGGESTKGLVNAQYCNLDQSVAWDRGELLPGLDKLFGPMAVVTVLAHEMGHSVQFQLGAASGISESTPTIVKEQQADCFAGTFFRWVAEGNAKHFRISTGDGLNKVLSTMLFIRDNPGGTATGRDSHGSAFDRVTAFQFGFSDGPRRCAKIDEAEINNRITELGFNSKDVDQGNISIDADTLGVLKQNLDAAFKKADPTPPEVKDGDGSCPSGGGTPPASYCPSDNQISVDVDKLAALGTPPKGDSGGSGIGDFAAFAEVASRYVLAVQQALKIPLDDQSVGLRTACLTGAWAGVTRHKLDGVEKSLLLSPGDLDEAVAELLSDHSVIAAGPTGGAVPSGFARVEAFRVGFMEGSTTCTTKFP